MFQFPLLSSNTDTSLLLLCIFDTFLLESNFALLQCHMKTDFK